MSFLALSLCDQVTLEPARAKKSVYNELGFG
jgi:hypothetical protein